MRTEQTVWTAAQGWSPAAPGGLGRETQLVLIFGATAALANAGDLLGPVRRAYPQAFVFGCSTAGEIAGDRVLDDSLVVTAARFDHTFLLAAETTLGPGADESFAAGERLAGSLPHHALAHVLVLSDGLKVNGTDLVKGLAANLPAGVTVTGGLSGDGARFQNTLVCTNKPAGPGKIAVIGFYGTRLKVGYGSMGGWEPFGPDRRITGSAANVLRELDGESALTLYKDYLGAHAAELPASGLLFPLSIHTPGGEPVVRTILAVNELDKSMTFAGDMPPGCTARFMRADFARLIDAANGAARTAATALGPVPAQLAIAISCVGRKLVLKSRVEEEVRAVRDAVGPNAALTGFYSYGEIAPFSAPARCELHNQTMTVTTFAEA